MARIENVRKGEAEDEAAQVSNIRQWKPFIKKN